MIRVSGGVGLGPSGNPLVPILAAVWPINFFNMTTITDNAIRANYPKGWDAKPLAYVRDTRIGSQGCWVMQKSVSRCALPAATVHLRCVTKQAVRGDATTTSLMLGCQETFSVQARLKAAAQPRGRVFVDLSVVT